MQQPSKFKYNLYTLLAALSVVLLFAYFIQLLWNYGVGSAFGLDDINYWQALAIYTFVKILTGRNEQA